jgi:hypothetical protein
MIEKSPKDVPHANTAFSGGSFHRTSEAYPAEKFYRDMISLSGGRGDPELTNQRGRIFTFDVSRPT